MKLFKKCLESIEIISYLLKTLKGPHLLKTANINGY